MSFIEKFEGMSFDPGWFLANDENCTRKTQQIASNDAWDFGNGAQVVPTGAIYPANDSTAIGIVYESVDVTTGDMPGSVVMSGVVYEDRLPVELASAAKTALEAKGFVFIDTPPVTRPY